MNRLVWLEKLSPFSAPAWPCPECGQQSLRMVSKSLQSFETSASKREHGHEGWDPEWIQKTFIAWVRCPDTKCAQEVAVVGFGGPEQIHDPDDPGGWEDVFTPLFATPMPDIFALPPKCPASVATELRASFRLFWSDPSASANRLRSAIERLLDHLGVKARERDKARKQIVQLSLHRRIVEFQAKEQELGKQLLALKWLGNTGSHSASVAVNDLLDAFEIAEHCLVEVLTQRSKRIAALSKRITIAHGSSVKKRKKKP